MRCISKVVGGRGRGGDEDIDVRHGEFHEIKRQAVGGWRLTGASPESFMSCSTRPQPMALSSNFSTSVVASKMAPLSFSLVC